ncbi:MAG: hypothetical protein ACRD1G_08775 [Acidimicrobiales bacterium]
MGAGGVGNNSNHLTIWSGHDVGAERGQLSPPTTIYWGTPGQGRTEHARRRLRLTGQPVSIDQPQNSRLIRDHVRAREQGRRPDGRDLHA